MTKEEYRTEHLNCIHNLHNAVFEFDVDFWSGKAFDNIAKAKDIISDSDADYARDTISVCERIARNRIQRGT